MSKPALRISILLIVLILLAVFSVFLIIYLFSDSKDPQIIPESTGSNQTNEQYRYAVSLAEQYIHAYRQSRFLTVFAGDHSIKIDFEKANAPIDYDAVKQYITGIGGDSSVISIYRTVKAVSGDSEPEIDLDYLTSEIRRLELELDSGKDSSYLVDGTSVLILRGTSHLSFDFDTGLDLVVSRIKENDISDLHLDITSLEPLEPDWDLLISEFNVKPVNATYNVDEAGNTYVVESLNGIELDIDSVKESYLNENWSSKTFYGNVVYPEITTESIENGLFETVLGEMTTSFSEKEESRTNNVKLAAQSINGCIILPGFRFSFNNTVGERTEERGYQDALIYVSDGVEPGLGGGICQVSSTLYIASLKAGLKQDLRYCHMYTVSYVDLGLDATVSWGNLDYVFTNSTSSPIKIITETNKGKLTIKILGTSDYDSKAVSFRRKITETFEPETIIKVDDTLAPGTQKTDTKGKKGYRVDTYRTVTINGVKQEEEWISTSIYSPINTIIIEGPPKELQ